MLIRLLMAKNSGLTGPIPLAVKEIFQVLGETHFG